MRLSKLKLPKDESGIAIFMVIAAVTILSVLVTEFTYVAQVNARMAFDSTDQIKAHYLAKTGLKISLLRLKAYKELKSFGGGNSPLPKIPKPILDQVWSFPFVYPLPNNLPGMLPGAKDEIDKFEKESSLSGKFTATIESESDKININSIIADFAPLQASPSPSPSDRTQPRASPSPSASPIVYSAKEAREGMKEIFTQIIQKKFIDDPGFAAEYRDLQVDELFDNILGWVDYTHQPRNSSGKQAIPYKRAPFYNMSELRMIYPMDDDLFDLLAPNFTTAMTNGFNVNTMREPMLRAIFSQATDEEITEFFKFRDSTEEDNTFQSVDDFWKYIEKSFAAYRSTDDLKNKMIQQGIKLITDEETFKIKIVAQVNQATRILEAWVTMDAARKTPNNTGRTTPNPTPTPSPSPSDSGTPGGTNPAGGTGLRITFMRES